ncbi:Thiol-disulfide isomerase or thioredoxin [Tenacibaculum sp. MAR_2009_124]|uniref:TlpA family protein disulfide reductase n=1 Tax=Tenacibaculum sp. MAR_2009_124 TaxID=1250059 RepID=UPI00089993B4|nr:TlpA disulfide reductase family protein [Tenacibaculum sp. MAR_2009_124]SEC24650.1 Thiol-disulfide isomerase or thioredoxin [Tenacibaculum sp. MAR_2009_124]
MKRLIYMAVACLAIVSCKEQPKDYVTFTGKITNKNSDSLVVANPKTGAKKIIKVDETGTFSDTLKVETGLHVIFDGKEQTTAFLKNGSELNLTLDTKEFDETVVYTGKGADESNFLVKSSLIEEELLKSGAIFQLPKEEFEAKLKSYEESFEKRLIEKTLDTSFVATQKGRVTGLKNYASRYYEQVAYINKNLAKGLASPKFVNFENHKGGTTSLDDLKGKYVFIDVWATWCQPCKNEIPYLKKVEEKFHGKNIEFVGISIDQAKDHETWKNMVSEKDLAGTQLFADNNWNSEFVKSYKINGIPRFILIDPQGNIINAQAPRPSDAKLVEVLESLSI